LSSEAPKMKPTLGLTGLTVNAMALIAPGAFLWLTFAPQCLTGAPYAGMSMWFGILAALALCFATAISYAELSKLYPGAGSSYFFAEQAFLAKTQHARYARIAKFIVGWASHLYYWVYPGVMVGTTAILVGYLLGVVFNDILGAKGVFSTAIPSPLLMILFCVVFAFGVAYIAYRGVTSATGVNVAINVVQITALLIFSVIAIGYRASHTEGQMAWQLDPDGKPVNYQLKPDEKGNPTSEPLLGPDGKPVPFKMDAYKTTKVDGTPGNGIGAVQDPDKPDDPNAKVDKFVYHESAGSVVAPHNLWFIVIQASIAILILVGFESVTSMGEEAKNAQRDIPRAVLLSLFIQGVVCYLIEYFAANYFLNPAYDMTAAAGSAAPIGDMMKLTGAALFNDPAGGTWFMFFEAITVFLALVGTTLSCINTGARVTYAMGRDDEVPSHFGMLHGKNLTPHRAIWTLALLSAAIGIVCVYGYFWGGSAQKDTDIAALPKNLWYSFGLFKHDLAANLPQTLLAIALASNFGTFLLYMLTNVTAIVAFRDHHTFNGIKHMVIPVFGVLANFLCMLIYLIGPLGLVEGMSWKETYAALGIAVLWGAWGMYYFLASSKKKGKPALLDGTPADKQAAPTY
jgi:APA family basic amino acid/polyamine antiporter